MTCASVEWMNDEAKVSAAFKFLSRRLNFGALNDAQMLALDQLVARNGGGRVPPPSSPRSTCSPQWQSAHRAVLPSTTSAASSDPDPGLRPKRRHSDEATTTFHLTKRRKPDSIMQTQCHDCRDGDSNIGSEAINDKPDAGDHPEEVRRQRISIAVCGRTLMSRTVTGLSSDSSPNMPTLRNATNAQRLSANVLFCV